jgi:cytochrome c biogenesis protein CcdA/thiol-disulfide isomerase/thioredoxin
VPLIILSLAGGLLSVLSPCILPIVPLVFSRATRSGQERALMLAGLALTFAVVTTAGTLGIEWIGAAGELGRWIALAFMGVVALSLASERAAVAIAKPFVGAGARIDAVARGVQGRFGAVLSGCAIGLLWAPCAGPILGLVIVGGRAPGRAADTLALLSSFALGATAALALALYFGRSLAALLFRNPAVNSSLRRALCIVPLLGVLSIAFGWDRSLLAKGKFVQTAAAEEALVRRLATPDRGAGALGASIETFAPPPTVALADEGAMPEFAGGREWINSLALSRESLRGKVVLVDFWTFECINCLHALPHVKELYAKYKDQGLVVIGVHTPELARERVAANVRAAVKDLGISYPVVIDGDYAIWNAWRNEYWPAAYFVDAKGMVRYHHFGEGNYEEEDAVVRQLLAEARAK